MLEPQPQAKQVKECMKVTMEYTVRTTSRDGEVRELPTTTCSFVYGVDVQYPSVESAIINKYPGDRTEVYIPEEELFGPYDESLVRELPLSDYKRERIRPGKVYREIRKGCLVQFLVREVRGDVIVADFNDPGAGSTATFEILVRDVCEATKDEMKPACARLGSS